MFGVEAFSGSLSQWAGAINLASTAFNVFGGFSKANQEGDYYDAQARVAAESGQVEREVGQVRARRVRRAGESDVGKASAAYAGAGVDVGSASAAAVVGELSSRIELDALTEILTGERRGRSLDQTAEDRRRAADNARRGGLWSAGSSLLGGFARQSEISRWNKKTGDIGMNALGTRGPIGGTVADPWYG